MPMRLALLLLLSLAVTTSLLVLQGCLASQEPDGGSSPADIEKQVQEILAAKYPYESSSGPGVSKGYRTLFKRVGAEGIRELQRHSHDGIAIQAAWEAVALTVPEREPARAVRPDRHKLEWFLGF